MKTKKIKVDGIDVEFNVIESQDDIWLNSPIILFGEVVKKVNGSLYIIDRNPRTNEIDDAFWFAKKYCNQTLEVGDCVDIEVIDCPVDRQHGLPQTIIMENFETGDKFRTFINI